MQRIYLSFSIQLCVFSCYPFTPLFYYTVYIIFLNTFVTKIFIDICFLLWYVSVVIQQKHSFGCITL